MDKARFPVRTHYPICEFAPTSSTSFASVSRNLRFAQTPLIWLFDFCPAGNAGARPFFQPRPPYANFLLLLALLVQPHMLPKPGPTGHSPFTRFPEPLLALQLLYAERGYLIWPTGFPKLGIRSLDKNKKICYNIKKNHFFMARPLNPYASFFIGKKTLF